MGDERSEMSVQVAIRIPKVPSCRFQAQEGILVRESTIMDPLSVLGISSYLPSRLK